MTQIVLDKVDKVYAGWVKGIDGLSLEIADGAWGFESLGSTVIDAHRYQIPQPTARDDPPAGRRVSSGEM